MTNSIKSLSTEQLKELGLGLDRLGAPKTYPWPEVATGEAKGVVARVTLAAVLSGTTPMNPAAIPALEQVGVADESADRAPWNVRLSASEPDGFIAVRVPTGAHEALLMQPERQDQVAVDFVRAGSVLVSGPRGDVLVIADRHGVTFAAVSGISVAPAAVVEAPALAWLAEAQCTDSWLNAEVSQLLQRGGPWANVSAAAIVARYVEPAGSVTAKVWLDATLAGKPVPALATPRQWARQLQPAQVRTVQELARAETTRLALMLDDVAETALPETGPWQNEWLDACHGRDDLEGVWILLREASAADPLTTALERLDRTGRVVRNVLPSTFVPADERTRRASRVAPDSWWSTTE